MFNIFNGIVAEDKAYNSKFAFIFVQEFTPFYTGDLKDKTGEEQITITNADSGSEINATATTTNTVVAVYLNLEANRPIPPDIRKGEEVFVISYQDSDLLYWIPKLSGKNIYRKLESYRIQAINTKEKVDQITDDNTYFIELDTLHTKSIRIKTSKSDGEKYVYEFKIDAKEDNSIVLKDDSNNSISLKSDVPGIFLENRNGCQVHLDDEKVHIQNKQESQIDITDQRILIQNKAEQKIEITEVAINIIATDINLLGNTNVSIIAPTVTLAAGATTSVLSESESIMESDKMATKASTEYTINSPIILLDGNVTITKKLDVAGPSVFAGPITIPGKAGGCPCT